MTTAYTAAQIFTGTEWHSDHAILVRDNKVHALLPIGELDKGIPVQNFPGSFIAPAFIDIQLYGAHGTLLSVEPNPKTVSNIKEYCRAGGAALCLPTVATNTKEVFKKSIDAVRLYWEEGGEGVWGLHLEGPWINSIKRGAHLEHLIHTPEIDEVTEILNYGKGIIKMITLAPEVCSLDVVKLIQAHGIIVAAGHTNATFEEATGAFDGGIGTVTHMYNAMSPLGHRAPGMVGAVMAHEQVTASIIADGHHVDFAAIKIAKEIMKERLFIITDAVTETADGPYQHQRAGDKFESAGILSGSAITMFGSFKNLVQKVGIEKGEALRMCSLYPARVLGCDNAYGKIEPGYPANLVIIDNDLSGARPGF
jgi:N-acetylglucosamine-6-phosphate deacetylase